VQVSDSPGGRQPSSIRAVYGRLTPGYLCPPLRYGEGFARDLGHLFEQYIGRRLRLPPGAQVLGEVTYGPKNDRRKTVD
jgi:hypothetical protein